ncbi:MAG: hypothetical protein WAT79_17225 [Saprospiraceae bacterium]
MSAPPVLIVMSVSVPLRVAIILAELLEAPTGEIRIPSVPSAVAVIFKMSEFGSPTTSNL